MMAFQEMSDRGLNTETINHLSGGMYTAMSTTLAGLFVGIIAYMGYNYLVSKISKTINKMETISVDFLDLIHDKKDSKKKLNIPIQVLWGKNTLINKCFNPIDIWQKYTKKNVVGEALNCYHFIPEEIPVVLNQKLMQFLK